MNISFVPQYKTIKAVNQSFAFLAKLNVQSCTNTSPVHVCAVLDTSGSMAGDSIRNAQSAIRKIIKYLGEKDVFHFVTYSDKAHLVIQNGNLTDKPSLHGFVNSTVACGGTNISDGLNLACEVLLKQSEGKAGINRKIFLFSDGAANEGIVTSNGLKELAKSVHSQGISITSFGIGSHYNEDIMNGIANNAGGDYYYVDKVDMIPSYVSQSIRNLIQVYATNGRLTILPEANVEISSVGSTKGNFVLLGEVYSEKPKNILINCNINAQFQRKSMPILSFILQFEREGKEHQLNGSIALEISDVCKLQEESNEVHIAMLMKKASIEEKLVLNMLDQGAVDDAIKTKNDLIKSLKQSIDKDKEGYLSHLIDKMEMAVAQLDKNREAARKAIDFQMHQMQGGDIYSCSSPTYSPCSPAFINDSVFDRMHPNDYTPSSPSYHSTSPNLSPAYTPTSPSYVPSSPYCPSSPSYTPDNDEDMQDAITPTTPQLSMPGNTFSWRSKKTN